MSINSTESPLNLAKKVAAIYAKNPNIVAVLIGGSVARNDFDKYSDIDLGVFWDKEPTDSERSEAVDACKGELVRLYKYDEAERVWCDDYKVSNMLFEVSHYLEKDAEEFINDVVKDFDTSDFKQNLISGILIGLPVYGESILKRWKDSVTPYPRELAVKMLKAYGMIDFFYKTHSHLYRENNLLMFYELICKFQKQLLYVLLALNGQYYSGFKRFDSVISQMKIIPKSFSTRSKQVFTEKPEKAIDIMHELILEVFKLIEIDYPEVDIARFKKILEYDRSRN